MKITLNLKGLKAFDKDIFEFIENNELLQDDLYYMRFLDNEVITQAEYGINLITKEGTSIEVSLKEFTDYERPQSNEYEYKILIDPIPTRDTQRIIYCMSPIDIIEALHLIIGTY